MNRIKLPHSLSYEVNVYVSSIDSGGSSGVNAVYSLDNADFGENTSFDVNLVSVSASSCGVTQRLSAFYGEILPAFYPIRIEVSDRMEVVGISGLDTSLSRLAERLCRTCPLSSDPSDSMSGKGPEDEILCSICRGAFFQHVFRNRISDGLVYFLDFSGEAHYLFSVCNDRIMKNLSKNEEFFEAPLVSEHVREGGKVFGSASFYYKYLTEDIPSNILASYYIMDGKTGLRKEVKIDII